MYASSFWLLIYYVYLKLTLFKNQFYVVYFLTGKAINMIYCSMLHIENILK